MRARLDGEDAIIGVLQLGATAPDLSATTRESWTVDYTTYQAHTWPTGEKRIGPLDAAVADRAVQLYQVAGEHPVTFVSLR